MNEYQNEAAKTAKFNPDIIDPVAYAVLGLTGEAGELSNKVKKLYRDNDGEITDIVRDDIKKELGDILWYISQTARLLDISFEDVATANIEKLRDREARGVIKGAGDNR